MWDKFATALNNPHSNQQQNIHAYRTHSIITHCFNYNTNMPRSAFGFAPTMLESFKIQPEIFTDISEALRHEFITFVTRGINQCTEKSHAQLKALRVKELYSFRERIPELISRRSDLTVNLTVDQDGLNTRHVYPFTEHAGTLFAQLRLLYGINKEAYLSAFREGEVAVNLMTSKFSEGKSGQFFYWSLGKLYLVKTLEEAEHEQLLTLLPGYFCHMSANPDTLISRFLGWYTIQMHDVTKRIIVMENVLLSDDGSAPQLRFDLKGSWIGRSTGKASKTARSLMKDADLQVPIRLPRAKAQVLIIFFSILSFALNLYLVYL